MKNDDLPVSELEAFADFEDDVDFDERAAELDEQIELLEARIKAARLAGA